jgi:hypothetical protein
MSSWQMQVSIHDKNYTRIQLLYHHHCKTRGTILSIPCTESKLHRHYLN